MTRKIPSYKRTEGSTWERFATFDPFGMIGKYGEIFTSHGDEEEDLASDSVFGDAELYALY